MKDIDLQIEEIESARQELKKHFGEHYELSALVNTIPLLEELKLNRNYYHRGFSEGKKIGYKKGLIEIYDDLKTLSSYEIYPMIFGCIEKMIENKIFALESEVEE